MSIGEVLLFISSASKASVPCVNALRQYQLPIGVLRLDTEESRSKAASGKYFQITAVPTLVVVYNDGNVQLFLGAEKVLQWMAETAAKMRPPRQQPSQPYRGVGTGPVKSTGGNMYGPGRPHPSRRPTRQVDYGDEPDDQGEEPGRDQYPDPDEGDMETPVQEEDDQLPPRPPPRKAPKKAAKKSVIEDEDDTPVPVPTPPAKKKPEPASILKKGKSKSKKKGKKGIKFAGEGEDDSVQILQAEPDDPQPKKKQSSRMQSVFEMAKKMETDRQNTLGYKEEDLPKYH